MSITSTNARAACTSTLKARWLLAAPSEKQASEFLKTKEFGYQGGKKNLVSGRFILQVAQGWICVILGKLLYLASRFLPEKLKRNTSLFSERMNTCKAFGSTGWERRKQLE